MNDIIFLFFYNLAHRSEFFDSFVIFTASIFPYVAVFIVTIFLIARRASLREFALIFGSSILSYVFSHVLKILFHASRPLFALPDIQPLFLEISFSFPSGHATFFSALAVALFLRYKKMGYLLMSFALLIGIARIIAGVHFPLDILGGFILGSAVACLVRLTYRKFAYLGESV